MVQIESQLNKSTSSPYFLCFPSLLSLILSAAFPFFSSFYDEVYSSKTSVIHVNYVFDAKQRILPSPVFSVILASTYVSQKPSLFLFQAVKHTLLIIQTITFSCVVYSSLLSCVLILSHFPLAWGTHLGVCYVVGCIQCIYPLLLISKSYVLYFFIR